MNSKRFSQERGYALLGVLVLLSLGLLVSAGMLNSSATNAKTRALVTTQADNYYNVEETLNRVVGWLQVNSKSLVTAFTASSFGSNFDLGAPSLGDNEGQHFGVPTMVKMKGTNNSVMLSNNPFFGTSIFPSTAHIDNGSSFDAVAEFQKADLGNANARIILVWARETDGNFEPVFRVDVMTGNNPDRGVHSFSYVYSTLVTSNTNLNFYGEQALTLKTPNNDCSSYQYTYNSGSKTWNTGAERANCGVASDKDINISSKVNGTAASLLDPGIFLKGGNVSGATCEGSGCHGYALPAWGNFESFCSSHNGHLNINSDTTLPTGGCWHTVSIANKKTLFLKDTENPYYFKKVDFKANFAHLNFGENGKIEPGKQVTVYVEEVVGDHINGNQFYNSGNAPHQVAFNYIGARELKLNGTAAFNAMLVAPIATVTVNGNFNYFGGIWAKTLYVSGNAHLFADEQIAGTPVLSDMNFALKKTSQRYR